MKTLGPRRRARERALQVLYSLDTNEPDNLVGQILENPKSIDAAIARVWEGFEDAPAPEVQEYCRELVRGTANHLPEIDSAIRSASRNWRLERMARVDRNILRLASYEMTYVSGADAVPDSVVFDEAIELAKRFGTAESPSFVNGLLDKMLKSESDSTGDSDSDGAQP